LWLLSGLESGGINLQSVRHDEGKRIHCLRQHTSAVSVLQLAQDERSVLSGSWDKTVLDWDLNTGQVKRKFDGNGSQISAIEIRPLSSLPVPESSGDVGFQSNTAASDSADKPRPNGVDYSSKQNLPDGQTNESEVPAGAPSPTDSLFGGHDGDSLFGDNDDNNLGDASGQPFGDEYDDEFSRAIASGIQPQAEQEAPEDMGMMDVGDNEGGAPYLNSVPEFEKDATGNENTDTAINGTAQSSTNGLPHAEDTEMKDTSIPAISEGTPDERPVADTVFLDASIDGSIRIWDKRKSEALAKILPKNVPPWCMGACWSPDGNFIYAGRRNGTVEEFSLHKGFRSAERTFKFPQGSGPVSAVRAMPNGKHLVW
jgi:transcriptional activator SPT8